MRLPQDWEKYLGTLNGKQRHEIRRKMRNLLEAGESAYRVIDEKNALLEATQTFLQLFPDYRRDKAEFMTTEMQNYFHQMAESMAESGVLRYGVLEIGHKAVAMIMYFDYNENIYLYNSAYHPDYKNLSVGVISKARCIQDSIEKKKRLFDFLKGDEQYKSYLGGHEIPLYCCRIDLS
jgi:CelD/BcsL family acetyltransferase involved in cellulose biosynthesis